MHVVRTTSGAYVAHLGKYVVKVGDGPVGARVGAQAQWLKQYECQGLMPVLEIIGPTAYVMPAALEWGAPIDARVVFDTTLHLLKEYVWCHPATLLEGWAPSMRVALKLGDLLRPGSLGATHAPEVWDMFTSIDWEALPACLTHGDPTFCNVMFVGLDTEPVLCDPIPASTLPDIRALDLGKVMQSCFGFEMIVYGWRYVDHTPNPLWLKDHCEDENEWLAAIFFCAIHILRLLPYVDQMFHEEFTRVFDDVLRLRP